MNNQRNRGNGFHGFLGEGIVYGSTPVMEKLVDECNRVLARRWESIRNRGILEELQSLYSDNKEEFGALLKRNGAGQETYNQLRERLKRCKKRRSEIYRESSDKLSALCYVENAVLTVAPLTMDPETFLVQDYRRYQASRECQDSVRSYTNSLSNFHMQTNGSLHTPNIPDPLHDDFLMEGMLNMNGNEFRDDVENRRYQLRAGRRIGCDQMMKAYNKLPPIPGKEKMSYMMGLQPLSIDAFFAGYGSSDFVGDLCAFSGRSLSARSELEATLQEIIEEGCLDVSDLPCCKQWREQGQTDRNGSVYAIRIPDNISMEIITDEQDPYKECIKVYPMEETNN